jgi:hypothetical protein
MKSLNDFKTILLEEEKSDYSKFDMLVRAGLANKAQLARIHRILDKMTEERPQFNNADKEIMRNLFNRMIDLISNNKQIFQKTRQAVREETEVNESELDTADYKIGPSGRKVRAHRFKVGDAPVKEEVEIEEATLEIPDDPPFVLVLKRKAIRMYPNRTKIALYYNQKLDKYFSIPYGGGVDSAVQAESVENIKEEVHGIEQLKKIRDNKQHGTVNHKDGSASKVDAFTASAILAVHDKVNDDNKKKLNDMVSRSAHHLQKVADFAHSKTK